jgi:hypothetical protein
MSETGKLPAFLAAGLAAFGWFGAVDERRARAGFLSLRSHGRLLKRAGDGCRQR